MGKLIYMLNVSLDGFVETVDKDLGWASVDAELHSWFNDRTREIEASIYGRGLYETMNAYWPTAESDPAATPEMLEFARLWKAVPKIVFSSTLTSVEGNCRLVSGDVADELARLREEFEGDIELGGATIAASFIERGLVDEYRMVVHPVILGDGTPYLPKIARQIPLRLVETRRFESGAVYLGYVAAGS